MASNAPRQIEDGFASSPANIERDHGVGYERCSILSIAFKSLVSRRRSSILVISLIGSPIHVRNTKVHRLHRLRRAVPGRECRVEAGARQVALVPVGRDLRRGEDVAVADGSVADTDRAGFERPACVSGWRTA